MFRRGQKVFKLLSSLLIVQIIVSTRGNDAPVKLYGIDVDIQDTISLLETSQLEVFGADVASIRRAYLSSKFDCRNTEARRINLKKDLDPLNYRATFKPLHVEGMEEETSENNLFYFCTVPEHNGMSWMVKVDFASTKYILLAIPLFIFLLIMSAIFSGLNLAIMSFSINDLQMIEEYDTSAVKRQRATDILLVRRHNNFVLCSIITGNVICNTAITLILDYLVDATPLKNSILVEITSTAFQLVFTEILPALFFTKNALHVASKLHYLVIFFMVLTCPMTWPISKILDIVVGKDDSSNDKEEVEMLTGLQGEESNANNKNFNEVVSLVRNTLTLRQKKAADIMTPIDRVYMISDQQVVTKKFLNAVVSQGHTRLPVCADGDVNTIRGVLNIKDLVLMLADDASASKLTAATLMSVLEKSRMYRYVMSSMPVPQLMSELEKGCPMAIVVDYAPKRTPHSAIPATTTVSGPPYRVVGIVTLEDNLEEVVGEILDEKDIVLPTSRTKTYAIIVMNRGNSHTH